MIGACHSHSPDRLAEAVMSDVPGSDSTRIMETKDGRALSGLVVEKTDGAVALKDAQGKTVRVPTTEVEQLVPQSRSLMPELLLRDLTAQQVADLLEFLTTLR
jgi:putative heme-binding domain-containing protein